MSPSNQQKALAGRFLVLGELHRRGVGGAIIVEDGRAAAICATAAGSERRVTLRTKTKTSGDWQTTTLDGEPSEKPDDETCFWVLVDLPRDLNATPSYYVIPDWWMQRYVHRELQEHLARHGGARPHNPASTHCAIHSADVEEWHGRWDQTGLF